MSPQTDIGDYAIDISILNDVHWTGATVNSNLHQQFDILFHPLKYNRLYILIT